MLRERLETMAAEKSKIIPAPLKSVMADGIRQVQQSIPSRSIPSVGSKLPEFELTDSQGALVKSSEQTEQHQLVLTFFRGGW